MDFQSRFHEVKNRIASAALRSKRKPEDIKLLAVTKTWPVEIIKIAYGYGLKEFGENKIQEALKKIELLPADIRWHLLGRLQTNKINKIKNKFVLIQSIDSTELALALEKRLDGRNQEILLEVNISGENSKAGVEVSKVLEIIKMITDLPFLKLRGLMTIGPLTNDIDKQRNSFKRLKEIYDQVRALTINKECFDILSMGMSSDFEVAIEEGSTLVRLGTALFGNRFN